MPVKLPASSHPSVLTQGGTGLVDPPVFTRAQLAQARAQMAAAQAQFDQGLQDRSWAQVEQALAHGASWTTSESDMCRMLSWVFETRNVQGLHQALETTVPADFQGLSKHNDPLLLALAKSVDCSWVIEPLTRVGAQVTSPVTVLNNALLQDNDAFVLHYVEHMDATLKPLLLAQRGKRAEEQSLFLARTAPALACLWALLDHDPKALLAQRRGEVQSLHEWMLRRPDPNQIWEPVPGQVEEMVQWLSDKGGGWAAHHLGMACEYVHDNQGLFLAPLDALGLDWNASLSGPEDTPMSRLRASCMALKDKEKLAHWEAVWQARAVAAHLERTLQEGPAPEPGRRPRL